MEQSHRKGHRPTVYEIMLGLENRPRDILREIRSWVFPWRGRVLWEACLRFGSDPFPAASDLIQGIAESTSGFDVDNAFHQYYKCRSWLHRLVAMLTGMSPRYKNVFRSYRRLKTSATESPVFQSL